MDIEIIEDAKKKMPKRYIVFYLSIVVIIASFTFRLSYAYFAAHGISGESYQTVINSGDLQLSFLDTQYISSDKLVIIDEEEVATDAEKSIFKVKNTSNYNASYQIDLGVTISENLISGDFKWELLVDGVRNNIGTFADVSSGSSIKLTDSNIDIAPGEENNLELRIWLQNDPNRNQIELSEGTFTGVVSLTAGSK